RTRDLGYGPEVAWSREGEREPADTGYSRRREFLRAAGPGRPIPERPPRNATERSQALIDRGRPTARRRTARRRTARQPRSRRGRKIAIGAAAVAVLLVIGAMIVLRKGPSWPPSVTTVRSQITTACQNPNV